jgi:hypothetical protein
MILVQISLNQKKNHQQWHITRSGNKKSCVFFVFSPSLSFHSAKFTPGDATATKEARPGSPRRLPEKTGPGNLGTLRC